MTSGRLGAGMAVLLASAAMSGCMGGRAIQSGYEVASGGHAVYGRQIIVQHGCGGCHTIPGIPGAHGVFGPPLMTFARRTYIAGQFPNQPGYLVRWIMNPVALKPKTAMPDLGLSEQQSRDVAAYLYTLR